MRREGTIYLLDANEDVIRCRNYSGVLERNKIIEDWATMYAAKFSSCYIQISLKIDSEIKRPYTRKEKPVGKPERPKGVYNNIPVYKYD